LKAIENFWKIFDMILKILLYISALIVLAAAVGVSVDVLMRYFFSIRLLPFLNSQSLACCG